jgi:hypothetical protein
LDRIFRAAAKLEIKMNGNSRLRIVGMGSRGAGGRKMAINGADRRVSGAGVARIGDKWRKMAQIGATLAQGAISAERGEAGVSA